MTMTFPVCKIDISGVGGLRGMDGNEQTRLEIYHNSHGGFVLVQPHADYANKPYGGPSVELELNQFKYIIEAFKNTEIPKDPFTPFYRGTFGPKGMMFSPNFIFAYFLKEKKAMTLEERNVSWEGVPNQVDHVTLTLDEFLRAAFICNRYYNKPVYGYHAFDSIEVKQQWKYDGELQS